MAHIIDDINQMRSVLSNDEKIDYAFIQKAFENPVIRSYVLQYLTRNFSAEWFKALYEVGVFNVSNIPGPRKLTNQEEEESRGFNTWEACFLIWEAAKQNAEKGNLLPFLLEIIDTYIGFAQKYSGDPDRNFTVDYYMCQYIMLLPEGTISDEHFEFIVEFGLKQDRSILTRDLSERFLSKTLCWSEQTMTYRLLDLFFSSRSKADDFRMQSVVDDYYLEQLVKRIAAPLYEKLGTDIIEWVIDKISNLAAHLPFQFLKFSIPSLEPDEQNSSHEGLNTAIVDLLVRLLEIVEIGYIEHTVSRFLDQDKHIFKRIAFLTIDKHFETLKGYFWSYNNPLNDRECKLEVYRILNRHCKTFSKEQIEVVYQWIVSLELGEEMKKDVNHERYAAYEKLEWAIALEPVRFKYKNLTELFNELRKKTDGNVPRHPGYDSFFEVRSGGEYAASDRILQMEPTAVLNLLTNPQDWKGYDHWGLEQDVRDYVLTNTDAVMDNIKQFLHIPIEFLYNFTDGFRTLAERSSKLDYPQLFQFFLNFSNERNELCDFANQEREKSGAIGMIAWFVDSAVQNEDLGLDLDAIQLAGILLLTLESKYSLPFSHLNSDAAFDVVNATRGKLYRGLVSCSMKENKLAGNQPGVWNDRIKNLFTRRAIANPVYAEFFWSVGFFTPQISYLDFDWLTTLKENIFRDHGDSEGDLAFQGYLLHASRVYNNIFELLLDRYEHALYTKPGRTMIQQRLVEHIYIAYLIGIPGGDRLLKVFFDTIDVTRLRYLITRMINPDVNHDQEKFTYIWDRILNLGIGSSDKMLKKEIATTSSFIDQMDNADKGLELFERSLSFAEENTPTYNLIRMINSRSAGDQSEYPGKLLKMILNHPKLNFYHDFDTINEFIKKSYQAGQVELADDLAIAGVKRRDFEALDLYNQFHPA